MGVFDFMNNNPITSLLICAAIMFIICRALRFAQVAIRGWPPAHLDADGDWKSKPEGDET